MDLQEKAKLKEQYRRFTDPQISQMIADGADAFVAGAYELLQEEARLRGIDTGDKPPAAAVERPSEPAPAIQPQIDINTYVQLVIVNNPADRQFLETLLGRTDIGYFFQNLHTRHDAALPAGMMIEQSRVEETEVLLKDFKPVNSIILW